MVRPAFWLGFNQLTPDILRMCLLRLTIFLEIQNEPYKGSLGSGVQDTLGLRILIEGGVETTSNRLTYVC